MLLKSTLNTEKRNFPQTIWACCTLYKKLSMLCEFYFMHYDYCHYYYFYLTQGCCSSIYTIAVSLPYAFHIILFTVFCPLPSPPPPLRNCESQSVRLSHTQSIVALSLCLYFALTRSVSLTLCSLHRFSLSHNIPTPYGTLLSFYLSLRVSSMATYSWHKLYCKIHFAICRLCVRCTFTDFNKTYCYNTLTVYATHNSTQLRSS